MLIPIKGFRSLLLYCRVDLYLYLYIFWFDQNKDFFVPGLDYEELSSQIRTRDREMHLAYCPLPIAICPLPIAICPLPTCHLPTCHLPTCLDKADIGHIRETNTAYSVQLPYIAGHSL